MKHTTTKGNEVSGYNLANCRAVDGDCVEAQIELPFGISIVQRIRLRGFFAPELTGAMPEAARIAQERLQLALVVGETQLCAKPLRRDSYGRLIGCIAVSGVVLDGSSVLGDAQLSESAHRADLAFVRGLKKIR